MAFGAMFKTAELVSQCIPKRYHRYQTEQPLKLFASKTLWGLQESSQIRANKVFPLPGGKWRVLQVVQSWLLGPAVKCDL